MNIAEDVVYSFFVRNHFIPCATCVNTHVHIIQHQTMPHLFENWSFILGSHQSLSYVKGG